jgi:hypothetical protein
MLDGLCPYCSFFLSTSSAGSSISNMDQSVRCVTLVLPISTSLFFCRNIVTIESNQTICQCGCQGVMVKWRISSHRLPGWKRAWLGSSYHVKSTQVVGSGPRAASAGYSFDTCHVRGLCLCIGMFHHMQHWSTYSLQIIVLVMNNELDVCQLTSELLRLGLYWKLFSRVSKQGNKKR